MLYVAGSVRGGTQLQEFTSVGDRPHASNTKLILTHVSQVFVTVAARNRAGLVGVAYSKPVIVDFTPPEILFVREEKHSLQGKTPVILLNKESQYCDKVFILFHT